MDWLSVTHNDLGLCVPGISRDMLICRTPTPPYNAAEKVVYAEEVKRGGNQIQIALANERIQHDTVIGNFGRIPSTREWIEECSI